MASQLKSARPDGHGVGNITSAVAERLFTQAMQKFDITKTNVLTMFMMSAAVHTMATNSYTPAEVKEAAKSLIPPVMLPELQAMESFNSVANMVIDGPLPTTTAATTPGETTTTACMSFNPDNFLRRNSGTDLPSLPNPAVATPGSYSSSEDELSLPDSGEGATLGLSVLDPYSLPSLQLQLS